MAAIETGVLYRRASLEHHQPFAIVLCSAAITAAAIALGFVSEGVNEYGWRSAQQYAERAAALLFLLPFLAGPIAHLFRIRALLIDRRAWGFGFAVAFAASIAVTIVPFAIGGQPVPATLVAYGTVGGLLLAVQVLTSNSFAIRKLGFSAWSRLHTFAMYAYWTMFTLAFLDRVVGPSRPDSFIKFELAAMVLALLIRFAASFAQRVRLAEKVA